jgi:ABC-type transporter Mla subunit MlaD
MSSEARYFRVGLFVLVGIVLIGGCTVLLGGQDLFKQTVMFETYFDESVQGLDVGSPVKLRGVKLGEVSRIGMVSTSYPLTGEDLFKHGQKIHVQMQLTPVDPDRPPNAERLRRLIDDGLRLRLTTAGLTGTSYIEADFVSPGTHPPMEIVWTPEHLYVPSAPSTLATIASAAERIAMKLEDAQIDKVIRDLNDLILGLTGTNTRIQRTLDSGRYDLEIALENLRVASENLRDLTDTAREYPSLMILGRPPAETAPGK